MLARENRTEPHQIYRAPLVAKPAKPSVFLDASSNFQPQLGARATISYSFMSIVMSSP